MNFEDMFEVGKILVVEDDVLVAKTIVDTLAVLGHNDVLMASDLKEASQTVSEQKIDLAFLDVKPAKGTRIFDLGKSLAKSGARVVFMTGHERLEMAQATVGVEFIEKPISPSRLKATLHRAIIREPLRTENAHHI